MRLPIFARCMYHYRPFWLDNTKIHLVEFTIHGLSGKMVNDYNAMTAIDIKLMQLCHLIHNWFEVNL